MLEVIACDAKQENFMMPLCRRDRSRRKSEKQLEMHLFEVFDEESNKFRRSKMAGTRNDSTQMLIESISVKGPSATYSNSHHNVGVDCRIFIE